MEFSKEQVEFMKRCGISINFSKALCDDDYLLIEEKISECLQKYGFGEDYSPTEVGKMCESILDVL